MKNNATVSGGKSFLSVSEAVVFAMLGTLMFCSKLVTEPLPNIHLLGMLTILYTVVFRAKALIPIYVFVVLTGLYVGFSMWWLPYLYLWTVLWGMTMLLPRNMSKKASGMIYPLVCCMHGLLYGTLYAPAQALMYGFGVEQTIAWIAAGIPWDIVHGVGNFVTGLLIYPLSRLLTRLSDKHLKSRY